MLLPFWNWFTVRGGQAGAYVVGMASLVAILVLLSALPSDANRTLVIAIAALAGFGVSAAHVVPNSILPDGIEWEELRTGSRREGFFFGVVSLLNKVGSSVAVPWVALVLAAAKFDESRGADQLPGTLVALRLLVGLVPAVLLALGVVAAAAYPLNKGRDERISPLLELRKARARGCRGRRGAAAGGTVSLPRAFPSSGIGLQRFASHSATRPQLKHMNRGDRARSLIAGTSPRSRARTGAPRVLPCRQALPCAIKSHGLSERQGTGRTPS